MCFEHVPVLGLGLRLLLLLLGLGLLTLLLLVLLLLLLLLWGSNMRLSKHLQHELVVAARLHVVLAASSSVWWPDSLCCKDGVSLVVYSRSP